VDFPISEIQDGVGGEFPIDCSQLLQGGKILVSINQVGEGTAGGVQEPNVQGVFQRVVGTMYMAFSINHVWKDGHGGVGANFVQMLLSFQGVGIHCGEVIM